MRPPFHFPKSLNSLIAVFSAAAIAVHLLLRFALRPEGFSSDLPLWAALAVGGLPMVGRVARRLMRREAGADLLAAVAVAASVWFGEYLAGTILVLMMSGGEALEEYAVGHASSVLSALARRSPTIAHRRIGPDLSDVPVEQVTVGDTLTIFPHEICPVDGVVVEGHGRMDEAYLTGEPFLIEKAPGSNVLSGAVNGEAALTITASKRAVDSRYSKIMEVMRACEKDKPRLRRLGDRLGAWYAPVALIFASVAALWSGDPQRFLSVLVVATPCPLLIGIPVAILGSISLCAKRSIIIKDPSVLERIDGCRTAIFDKTGTLTFGEPELSDIQCAPGFEPKQVLSWVASLERYSRHPLAQAVLAAAKRQSAAIHEVSEIREAAGQGIEGLLSGMRVRVVGRKHAGQLEGLPDYQGGMEGVVLVNGRFAALLLFRDTPRPEGFSFIRHLGPRHQMMRTVLVSGDRRSEVEYMARKVGIDEVHAEKSPEEKLELVRAWTAQGSTFFVGDGINDAPALMAATVGIAIGKHSDITAEAADAVVMDSSLAKIDELIHIGARFKRIVLQSAGGGMLVCLAGMAFAAAGWLTPVAGAILQELIDLAAVLNALRAALPPRELSDF